MRTLGTYHTKSCWTCEHADVSAGSHGNYYTPPEGDECDCGCNEPRFPSHLYERAMDWPAGRDGRDVFEVLADLCGHYQPRLIKQCAHCRAPINEPVAGWQLWAHHWGVEPCCSAECVVKLEAKYMGESDQ